MRLGILVDAACDLPREFIAQNPIRMMPIPIRIGDQEVVDVRDEDDTRDFSERVLAARVPGVEIRPFVQEQLESLFLERIVIDFDYVICLTLSASRSPIFAQTQNLAFQIITKYKPLRQAADVPGPFAIRVFDSGNMYAAQGVQIMELARLIRADTPVTRILRRMEEVIPQTYGYIVLSDLDYLKARARERGERSPGIVGQVLGSALDVKPVARCFRGETGTVAKVRHFAAAAERVFANVTREIERGLVVPFVNLSHGGDWTALTQLPAYLAMARAATQRGVDIHWCHLSMAAGVTVGVGALAVGIVAQPHDFT